MNANEQIEDYLNNELSENDRMLFEQALKDDLQLQQAVEQHRQLINRLRELKRRTFIRQHIVSNRDSDLRIVILNRRLLATAAVIVLAVAATYLWMTQSNDPSKSSIATRPTPPIDSISLENPSLTEQIPTQDPGKSTQPFPKTNRKQPAEDRPERLAYTETVAKLETIDYTVMGDAQKDSTLENKLNLAIDFLKAEKPSDAIPLLEDILSKNNSLYQEDAEWLLALAKLYNDPIHGKERLRSISQNPSHTYRIKALRLLKQLS
jgi:hypothetical protein